jgi:hypothetical protein
MLLYVPTNVNLLTSLSSHPIFLWLAFGPLNNSTLTRSQDPRGFVRSRFSNGARIGRHSFIKCDWRYRCCYTISTWRRT